MSSLGPVLAVAVVTLLTACGEGGRAVDVRPAASGSSAAGEATTSLTIILDEDGQGPGERFTLTCGPPGGEHPDPEAACSALEAAGGAEAFAPVPKDVACTEIYGGPQTAEVVGAVRGTPVEAQFSRVNGCEIARWDALAPLLGSAGGA